MYYNSHTLKYFVSIDEVIQLPQRKLIIAQNDILLDRKIKNEIFVLMVEESRGSAGGRAAGSGHRKISKVYWFNCNNGACSSVFETEDPQKIEQFEIPYSAVAIDIILSNGQPYVVQGVVDPDFIMNYKAVAGASHV